MSSKKIYCIRHGESTFNAAAIDGGADPLHYDARLSERGEQQVQRTRAKIHGAVIDLVLTSPLTRALQTTAGLFANHPSAPKVLVESLHRERVENSCDIGRSPALLSREFPAFSLAHLPEVWWHNEGEPDDRGICVEPLDVMHARADEFMRLLLLRSERSIAVVGHGTFFYRLTGRILANCEIFEFDT